MLKVISLSYLVTRMETQKHPMLVSCILSLPSFEVSYEYLTFHCMYL